MKFSPFPSNGSSPHEYKAKPTPFKGFLYPSRKEARLAEYLSKQQIIFKPHPSHWKGSYTPDFYLPEFGLFVEVKPKDLVWELSLHSDEIEYQGPDLPQERWICVDNLTRDFHGWHLLGCNSGFAGIHRVSVIEHDSPRIKFYRDADGYPQLELACPFIVTGLKWPPKE